MSKFKQTKADIEALPESGRKEQLTQLLGKAEFMDGQLVKLQKELKKKGWVEKYQNGASQYGLKKSTEGDVYNTLTKNFISVVSKICDLLPETAEENDELKEFIIHHRND